MKHLVVHYKNKYPGCRIESSEDKLDVYQDEKHLVALRRNGNGMVIDYGSEAGAEDKHDLSAIPKNARAYKLFADGKIGKSEEFSERAEAAKALAVDGKILSIDEYKKAGHEVSSDGVVKLKEAPKAPEAAPQAESAPQA